jgi:hypothetical protein
MMNLYFLPLATAVIAAFVTSAIWYILFAKQRANLSPAARESGRPQPKLLAAELIKNIVLALFLSYLIQNLNIINAVNVLFLGLAVWVAFPVLILISSVMYEKVPPKLAAIHAGDWLIKLLLMTAILGFWR